MAQQINLYSAVFQTPRRPFSTRVMLQSLALLVLVVGSLCTWTVTQTAALRRDAQAIRQQDDAQRQALAGALAADPAASAATASLQQMLQSLQRQQAERQLLLAELARGRIVDGRSHSARLALIARTVPAPVWLDEIAIDERGLTLSGHTMDPSALKAWIARLADEPLLERRPLATLQVEQDVAGHWRFVLASRGGAS